MTTVITDLAKKAFNLLIESSIKAAVKKMMLKLRETASLTHLMRTLIVSEGMKGKPLSVDTKITKKIEKEIKECVDGCKSRKGFYDQTKALSVKVGKFASDGLSGFMDEHDKGQASIVGHAK